MKLCRHFRKSSRSRIFVWHYNVQCL